MQISFSQSILKVPLDRRLVLWGSLRMLIFAHATRATLPQFKISPTRGILSVTVDTWTPTRHVKRLHRFNSIH